MKPKIFHLIKLTYLVVIVFLTYSDLTPSVSGLKQLKDTLT